ncbi:tail fiber/spike domain-containing protein [Morganella morganii]|uniref:tail fiber/spike domain-containing protein n=1 Tax=Morganella morganii TaxID=582 RepID=UPI00406B995C
MPTIPTQNAVPSEAPRDLKFNSGKIDEFVTSLEHEYKDRFGRCHMTIEGMRWIFDQLMERFKVDMNQAIIAAGYIPMDSFQQGAEITKRNEILRDETTGEYYRWDGDLPKSVPVGSTPESAGGVGAGKWVGVGDASLRTEIVNSGDKLVGSSFGNTVYADYSRLTIARKASFADGGILNSDKEAALAGDGFFYGSVWLVPINQLLP